LKKGPSSNSSPKTSGFIFSQIGLALYYYRAFLFLRALSEKKSAKKSLEKGFGERNFPQKGFSPIITYILLYKHDCYHYALFLVFINSAKSDFLSELELNA
jgi:hypothetical protein